MFYLPKSPYNVELGQEERLGCDWPKGIIFGDFHSFLMGTFWRLASLREQRRRTRFSALVGKDLPQGGDIRYLESCDVNVDARRRRPR